MKRKKNIYPFFLHAGGDRRPWRPKRERGKKSRFLSLSLRHLSWSSGNEGIGHSTRASGPTFAVPFVVSRAFVVPVVSVVSASAAVVAFFDRSTLSHAPQEQHLAGRGIRTGQARGARAQRRLEQPGQRAMIGIKSSGGGIIIFQEKDFCFVDRERKKVKEYGKNIISERIQSVLAIKNNLV